MTSRLPLPQMRPKPTPNYWNTTIVQRTWTASLVPWGCWRTMWCCWSAGWAPPGTGSTAAVAAAAACSATGWRRDPGCSSGCHSWSLEGQNGRKMSASSLCYVALLHRHVNSSIWSFCVRWNTASPCIATPVEQMDFLRIKSALQVTFFSFVWNQSSVQWG